MPHLTTEGPPDRLSRIETLWTEVFRAHQEQGNPQLAAQQQLLLRYRGAIYRYVLGALRDPLAAEELAQDFAVRFLEGAFRKAHPEKGRFRDLVKTALRHLVIDHWRRQGKAAPLAEPERLNQVPAPPEEPDLDAPFLDGWREELLAHAWEALEQAQSRTRQPYHTVLRWKTEQPKARSEELARRLGAHLGKAFSESALRKLLFRARALFADLLIAEVVRSLGPDASDRLEEELVDLRLLDYCRSGLSRRQEADRQ